MARHTRKEKSSQAGTPTDASPSTTSREFIGHSEEAADDSHHNDTDSFAHDKEKEKTKGNKHGNVIETAAASRASLQPPKIIRTRRGQPTQPTTQIDETEELSLPLPTRKRKNSAPLAKSSVSSPERKVRIAMTTDETDDAAEQVATEDPADEPSAIIKTEEMNSGEFLEKEKLESEFLGLKQIVLEEEIAAIDKEITSIEAGMNIQKLSRFYLTFFYYI